MWHHLSDVSIFPIQRNLSNSFYYWWLVRNDLLSRVEKNAENRLRMSILCVNISLLNSVGIQYINSANNKAFYFVMSIVFLMFAIHFCASIGKWESVQEELNK